jgi:cytochrome c oxidase subunit 2
MMTSTRFCRAVFSGTAAVAAALVFGACGSDAAGSDTPLPPAADAGRSVMRSNGCAACHGSDGQGGVGPAFVGLYGTEVELSDGTVVTADAEYLRRSIAEPRDEIVDGYRVPMPTNDLDDEEIDRVIDFIRAIGPSAADDEVSP